MSDKKNSTIVTVIGGRLKREIDSEERLPNEMEACLQMIREHELRSHVHSERGAHSQERASDAD